MILHNERRAHRKKFPAASCIKCLAEILPKKLDSYLHNDFVFARLLSIELNPGAHYV